MKPLQQDDIQDWLNEPNKAFRWIHLPTKKIVKGETKGKAINEFRRAYSISATRKDVRQARMTE